MGEAGELFKCNQGKACSIITGLTRIDISDIPTMVGRGVMIDISKQMGVDSLQAGQPITSDYIKAAMQSQGITVAEADLIILHAGYTDATFKQSPSVWA